jgi:hypothetical protein
MSGKVAHKINNPYHSDISQMNLLLTSKQHRWDCSEKRGEWDTIIWSENLNDAELFEDLSVDGKIVLR